MTGITGGEEDGVDNTGVDNAALYTQPEDIWEVYEALSQVTCVGLFFIPRLTRCTSEGVPEL